MFFRGGHTALDVFGQAGRSAVRSMLVYFVASVAGAVFQHLLRLVVEDIAEKVPNFAAALGVRTELAGSVSDAIANFCSVEGYGIAVVSLGSAVRR